MTPDELADLPEVVRGPVVRWNRLVEELGPDLDRFTDRLLSDHRYDALLDSVSALAVQLGQADDIDHFKAAVEALAFTRAGTALETIVDTRDGWPV